MVSVGVFINWGNLFIVVIDEPTNRYRISVGLLNFWRFQSRWDEYIERASVSLFLLFQVETERREEKFSVNEWIV